MRFIEPIRVADAAILERCKRIAHSLQSATGITCYRIADAGCMFAGMSWMIDVLNHFFPVLPIKTNAFECFMALVLIVLNLSRSLKIRSVEQQGEGETRPAELLQLREDTGFGWRILWTSTVIPALLATLNRLLDHSPYPILIFLDYCGVPLGMTIFSYFISIDPLPPGKSKVGQWIDSFRMKLIPVRG